MLGDKYPNLVSVHLRRRDLRLHAGGAAALDRLAQARRHSSRRR